MRKCFWSDLCGDKQSSVAVLLMSAYVLAQFMRGYAVLHKPLSKVHFHIITAEHPHSNVSACILPLVFCSHLDLSVNACHSVTSKCFAAVKPHQQLMKHQQTLLKGLCWLLCFQCILKRQYLNSIKNQKIVHTVNILLRT